MAQVEIVSEEERAGGWRFDVQVIDDGGSLHRRTLVLSWADYNLWSASGADDPAAVAAAVVRFILARAEPSALRPVFDASIARRLFPDADTTIPRLITGTR